MYRSEQNTSAFFCSEWCIVENERRIVVYGTGEIWDMQICYILHLPRSNTKNTHMNNFDTLEKTQLQYWTWNGIAVGVKIYLIVFKCIKIWKNNNNKKNLRWHLHQCHFATSKANANFHNNRVNMILSSDIKLGTRCISVTFMLFKWNRLENINSLGPSDAYMRQWPMQPCVQIMVCRCLAPKHYPKQCRNIDDWASSTKLQWNCNLH